MKTAITKITLKEFEELKFGIHFIIGMLLF